MTDRRLPTPRRNPSDRRDSDRRSDDRFPSCATIRFLRAGDATHDVLEGELTDASATGLQILLNRPLRTQERIIVEVRDPHGPCFNLLAEVIWTELKPGGGYQTGCELCVNLTPRKCALLKDLMRTNATSSTP